MKIRKAKITDLNNLHKILNSSTELSSGTNKETYSKKFIEGTIKNKERDFILVAEENKKIIGFIMAEIWKHKQYSFLSDIFVTKEYREKGTGEKLHDEYKKFCEKEGIKKIWGLTLMKNKKMQSILKKWNYKKGNKFYLYEKIIQ